jgi:hypothetical protein
MALIGMVIAIIGAVVAWVDKGISTAHLLCIVFVVLAFACGHLMYRGHQQGGWW